MKILVCGATYFTDYEKLHDELVRIINEKGWDINDITIISGMAKGADTLAIQFAFWYQLDFLEFPAEWDKYGKGAGPIRNQQMIDKGQPDLIVAFPMKSSRGTWDMINRGKMEDIEVIVIEDNG